MASLPPGECCTTEIEHDGTPNGTIENIENGECSLSLPITLFLSTGTYSYIYLVPTYFARPASPNGNAILIFSDVFGPIGAAGKVSPQSLNHAGNKTYTSIEIDTIFTSEKRSESEKILADLKAPYQINLYGAVSHGFALRGDLSIKEVKFVTDRAFEQAVTWFKYWL